MGYSDCYSAEKRKARQEEQPQSSKNVHRMPQPSLPASSNVTRQSQNTPVHEQPPSNLVSQLRTLSSSKRPDRDAVVRSEGFAEKPAPLSTASLANIPARDGRLAIVEELNLGPVEHKQIADDPKFERIEPNSGIRLRCVLSMSFTSGQPNCDHVVLAICHMTPSRTIYLADITCRRPCFTLLFASSRTNKHMKSPSRVTGSLSP